MHQTTTHGRTKKARPVFRNSSPVTLGELEQLAGVRDRSAFWLDVPAIAEVNGRLVSVPAAEYLERGAAALKSMISGRVSAGVLSLVYEVRP